MDLINELETPFSKLQGKNSSLIDTNKQLPQREIADSVSSTPLESSIPSDGSDFLFNATRMAPTVYNLVKGMFDKPEQVNPIRNRQQRKALEEIEQSKRFNVDDVLARNESGFQNIRNQARGVSTDSASYLQTLLAGQRNKQTADESTVANRERALSQINAQAANQRFAIGEQDRAEDRRIDSLRSAILSKKTDYLESGLEGFSEMVQRDKFLEDRNKHVGQKREEMNKRNELLMSLTEVFPELQMMLNQ